MIKAPVRTSLGHYILDADHRPVAVDLMTWARWFEDFDNRRVAETITLHFRVSTVCLGLDHRFFDKGPPLIFETMAFPVDSAGKVEAYEELDGSCWRYASWDDALAGHRATVRKIDRLEVTTMAAEARREETGE